MQSGADVDRAVERCQHESCGEKRGTVLFSCHTSRGQHAHPRGSPLEVGVNWALIGGCEVGSAPWLGLQRLSVGRVVVDESFGASGCGVRLFDGSGLSDAGLFSCCFSTVFFAAARGVLLGGSAKYCLLARPLQSAEVWHARWCSHRCTCYKRRRTVSI